MNLWNPLTETGRAHINAYERERRQRPEVKERLREKTAHYREANREQIRQRDTSEAYRAKRRERDARRREQRSKDLLGE